MSEGHLHISLDQGVRATHRPVFEAVQGLRMQHRWIVEFLGAHGWQSGGNLRFPQWMLFSEYATGAWILFEKHPYVSTAAFPGDKIQSWPKEPDVHELAEVIRRLFWMFDMTYNGSEMLTLFGRKKDTFQRGGGGLLGGPALDRGGPLVLHGDGGYSNDWRRRSGYGYRRKPICPVARIEIPTTERYTIRLKNDKQAKEESRRADSIVSSSPQD